MTRAVTGSCRVDVCGLISFIPQWRFGEIYQSAIVVKHGEIIASLRARAISIWRTNMRRRRIS